MLAWHTVSVGPSGRRAEGRRSAGSIGHEYSQRGGMHAFPLFPRLPRVLRRTERMLHTQTDGQPSLLRAFCDTQRQVASRKRKTGTRACTRVHTLAPFPSFCAWAHPREAAASKQTSASGTLWCATWCSMVNSRRQSSGSHFNYLSHHVALLLRRARCALAARAGDAARLHLRRTAQHSTAQHSTAQHSTAQHSKRCLVLAAATPLPDDSLDVVAVLRCVCCAHYGCAKAIGCGRRK